MYYPTPTKYNRPHATSAIVSGDIAMVKRLLGALRTGLLQGILELRDTGILILLGGSPSPWNGWNYNYNSLLDHNDNQPDAMLQFNSLEWR